MRIGIPPFLAIVLLMMLPAALLLYTIVLSDPGAEEGVPASGRSSTEPTRDDRVARPSSSGPTEPRPDSTHQAVRPTTSTTRPDSKPVAPEPEPGTGAGVTGRVLDPAGQPLGGVQVRLVRADSSASRLERLFGLPATAAETTVRTTRTRADGVFRLGGLDPDAMLRLEIRHRPYAPLVRTLYDLEMCFPAPLRLGDLCLATGAVIEGTCVDPEDAPLEAVEVRVEAGSASGQPLRESGAWLRGVTPDAVTDARGAFRIEGVPSGSVRVRADRPDRVPCVGPVLRVASGATTAGVRLVLRPGLVIAGTVTSPGGKALPGIEVFALRARRASGPDFGLDPRVRVRTDERGRFEIRGLEAGPYQVSAWAPGRSRVGVETVAGRRDVTLVFEPSRVFQIRGRVVVKGDGRPIEGATVRLVSAYFAGGGERGEADAFTDVEGRFEITARETWTRQAVTAVAEGFVEGRSAAFGLERDAAAPPEIILHLEAGAALEGRVTAVRDSSPVEGAVVILRRGEPDPRAAGFWRSVQNAAFESDRPLARVRTDATGRFRFACVPPGRHDLEVRHVEYADAYQEGLVVTAGEDRTGIEVSLGRGGDISGQVLFSDGAPAARVTVIARDGRGREKRRATGADGAFRFTRLAVGRHMVMLVEPGQARPLPPPMDGSRHGAAPGAASGSWPVIDVTEDGEVVRNLTIERGVRVEGRVLSVGRGAEGCTVTLHPRRPPRSPAATIPGGVAGQMRSAESGADGRYALENVKPGRYEAVVRFRDLGLSYDALRTLVNVPPASSFHLDLELPSGGIEGRVRRPGGSAPADRVHVRLNRTDGKGRYVRVGRTDPGGAFSFGHVAAGTYEIVVPAGPDWAVASRRDIVLGVGSRVTGIDIQLEAGVDVEGVVVDGEGLPVAAARVVAFLAGRDANRSSLPAPARTDAEGRFTLRRLPSGSHTFRAVKRREHSEPVKVVVPPGGKPETVRLVLERGGR